jgi:RNA polymerase sigma-70 factor (ECF subfamily)
MSVAAHLIIQETDGQKTGGRKMDVRKTEVAMSETPGSTRHEAVLSSEAQGQFVSGNMRRVFLLIYRIVGNVSDAQDLTQEAFIKALQRQDQLKDLDKAAHWLSRIASNTAIDFLRRSGRLSFSDLDDLPDLVSVSTLESPEQSVLRSERRERLEASLEVLTDRERTALLLRDVEDMPAEEVAIQLNCSKATVRSHIANARVKLRKHFDRLEKRGRV